MGAIALIKDSLLAQLKTVDDDGDLCLNFEEMRSMLQDERARKEFDKLQVDVAFLWDFLPMIFDQETQARPISNLLELFMSLRGDRTPTMQDMIDLGTFTHWHFAELLADMEERVCESIASAGNHKLADIEERVCESIASAGNHKPLHRAEHSMSVHGMKL